MCYIVFTILQERKPCRVLSFFSLPLMPSAEPLTVLYIASFIVFVGSQVVYMVPSKMLCQVGRHPS